MPQYHFGSGTVIGKRTDASNTTPAFLGVLQSVDIEIDRELKKLMGQYQSPVAIASAALNIKGKAKFAQFRMSTYNNLMLGMTQATGQLQMAVAETATIPTTPYQVTVAQSATFAGDLGVFFSSSGVPLTLVASAPATGQYSVNSATGVYTFAAADTGLGVQIYYNYNVAGTGVKTTIVNQLAGNQPTFQLNLKNSFTPVGSTSKDIVLQLNACVASKLTLPFKNQDFAVQELDFEAFADASGNIGTIATVE